MHAILGCINSTIVMAYVTTLTLLAYEDMSYKAFF
jgi:hypothetical protein